MLNTQQVPVFAAKAHGRAIHPVHPRKALSRMLAHLRSPAQTRQNIIARCAELVHERGDLDPAGPAYESKSLQIDAALSALWALGPIATDMG